MRRSSRFAVGLAKLFARSVYDWRFAVGLAKLFARSVYPISSFFLDAKYFLQNMDFSSLSNADQAKMQALIEKKQLTDFMNLYSSLVDRCFVSSNSHPPA
jgi:hypothetical protein